jgi:serine/threonine protein kinase
VVRNCISTAPDDVEARLEESSEMKIAMEDMIAAPRETVFQFANRVVEDKTADSIFFDSTVDARIPKFEEHEVRLGRVLGRGGFCVVREVDKVKITVMPRSGSSIGSTFGAFFKRSTNSEDAEICSNDGSERCEMSGTDEGPRRLSRVSLAALSKKKTREGRHFALKQVIPDLQFEIKLNYMKGVVDLAMEAKFLANLDHPNIISLCGVSKFGASDFIIIERLSQTLSSRFKDWMKIDRQCKGITGIFAGSKRKEADLHESRYGAALDISSACGYLHERKIVFRDLVRNLLFEFSVVAGRFSD